MTINELREKRNQAWEAAKAFVETKRDKDGLLSDEDAKTYAQMEKKVQDYGAEIERMEAMSAMDAQLSKPTSAPITEKPMNGKTMDGKKEKTGRASDAYKEGMLKALRTNFRNVSNVLQEGVDADGGYLVPEEYDSRLIEALEEENIFRKLGHTITTSGERKINIAATKPAAAMLILRSPLVVMVSVKSTSLPLSLRLRGLTRARNSPGVMRSSPRSTWTPTNSMLPLR